MSKTYSSFSTKSTPQSEPIPGEQQVQNNAGGYVYALDKWAALQRFLILGSEGGTYYVKERPLTVANAQNVLACIGEDGKRVVDMTIAVSDAGRAPKNDPAIFVLALAASAKDVDVRAYALAALSKVCRIPTHLFHFLTYLKQHRGIGRSVRRAIKDWYGRWSVDQLAYELVKYQGRDGWTNRDVLRIAHPVGANSALLRWTISATADTREVVSRHRVTRAYPPVTDDLPAVIMAFEEAKTATTDRLIHLIRDFGLTREMVPTESLTKPEVWEALLDKMPLTALLRNLGNMSKVGLLKPMSAASKTVVERLGQVDAYKKARVHPIAVLLALKTYASGRGLKGSGQWTAVPAVVDALDAGLYHAFGAVEPTGKRLLFGLDVSGSMSSACGGLPISCAEGAAVMALACAKSEQDFYIMGFANEFRDLGITPRMSLNEALGKTTRMNFGSTDCALPMSWAERQKIDVDAFIVITDNETWAGDRHPAQALRSYRSARGIAAKQIVIGMTATDFTIADPKDPLTLDVAGFDSAVPGAVGEFVR